MVSSLLVAKERGRKFSDREKGFVFRNRPRHKCKMCGNGGHHRRAALEKAENRTVYRPVSR